MKYKSNAILIFCASMAPTVLAQSGNEEIGGASRVSAKPAMQGHFKTGHSRPGTLDVVPIGDLFCKSHF